jgi:predicted secreted Zn-dependent protease
MDDLIRHALELARAGDRQQAAAILRDVLRRDPSQVNAWKLLAFVSTDDEEALYAARRALHLDPNDAYVRDRLRALEPPEEIPAPVERRKVPMAALVLIVVLLLGALATLTKLIIDEVREVTLPQAVVALDIAPSTPVTTVVEDFSVPVRVTTSTGYYAFEAASVDQIRYGLTNYAPETCCGYEERPIALTAYRLGLSWELSEYANRCELVDAEVLLEIEYTYPQWVAVGNPHPDLYDEWHDFMVHVTQHEEHHGALAADCAYQLADDVARIDMAVSCDQVDAALDGLLAEANRQCEVTQQAFDDAEGVTSFPLP